MHPSIVTISTSDFFNLVFSAAFSRRFLDFAEGRPPRAAEGPPPMTPSVKIIKSITTEVIPMKAAPPAISFPAFTIGEVCLSCFLHTMCISFILLLQDAHLSVPISPEPRNFSMLCFFIILDPMKGNLLISSTLSIIPLHFLQDQCLSFFRRANFFVRLTPEHLGQGYTSLSFI